ncbi:MAG: 3-oxoacyl-[acyl-carrier-protein] reductase [Bdellovibrionales bacterium]
MTKLFSLEGKRALVTGASGGIGQAIAKLFVEQGAKVALHGTNAEKLAKVQAELGANTVVTAANLSDPNGAAELFAAAEAALGGIDILVNNAGITRDQLSMRMTDDDWQAVLDVNLTSAFKLARAATKGMMKARWGRIISVTSIVGTTGNPGQANYAAAKAALVGMSKSLAAELATRNITVNCIAPGFIATAMTDVLNDDQKKAISGRIPAGRMGTPEEIAAGALYLASNEAAYVTGQTLHINGGMAMI